MLNAFFLTFKQLGESIIYNNMRAFDNTPPPHTTTMISAIVFTTIPNKKTCSDIWRYGRRCRKPGTKKQQTHNRQNIINRSRRERERERGGERHRNIRHPVRRLRRRPLHLNKTAFFLYKTRHREQNKNRFEQ